MHNIFQVIRNSLTIISLLILLPITSHAKSEKQEYDYNTLKMLDLFGYVFDQVKKEYVEEVQDKEIIESAINGMLTSLDPHSGYLNEKAFNEMKMQTKGEFGGLGIEVTMDNGLIKVISPIDDTPAFNAGIKTGDYIFAIDNEAVHGMSLPDAVEKMRGRAGTKIHLSILREGRSEPLELTLNRAVIKIKSVKSRVEGDIGYIRINTFSEQTANGVRLEFEKIKQQLGKNLKGLVLDLRNNPGGLLDQAVAVVDLFLDGGEIVSTRGRGEGSISRYNAHKGTIIGSLPTVILINGGSASASEIVAGALQDHKKAIIMGTKSFGKGSVQIVKALPPGHGAMRITNARYYTPSGRSIQAEGIMPDIIVEAGKLELAQPVKENKRLLSEANLKGHLKNKDKHKENEEEVTDNVKKDEKQPLSKSDEQAIYDKDYQLARAIDLIKGLHLFNNKKVKAN
jgi:carboxyl-terminal processing protease